MALLSDMSIWLATFLWTNISPISAPIMSSGMTLESEHPIHKYLGFCPPACLL